jgi:hypothetical protein
MFGANEMSLEVEVWIAERAIMERITTKLVYDAA